MWLPSLVKICDFSLDSQTNVKISHGLEKCISRERGKRSTDGHVVEDKQWSSCPQAQSSSPN